MSMVDRIEVKSLELIANDHDLLRDLFRYLDYARERSIKRMTRSNEIPRADLVRIAKLLEIDPPEKDDWMYAPPHWINFIDRLALRLRLVSYDLKGEYRGQSSQEPSFIENYVEVNESQLQNFLVLTPAEQEKSILDVLNRAKSPHPYGGNDFNEFFHYGPLSLLDAFQSWGAKTGILPILKFPEIRLFLLDQLKSFPPGQWFSVQSWIADLKANHPFFLIQRTLPKTDSRGQALGRYDNFYESKGEKSQDHTVPPDDPDAFERVEGRYIERFLEYIPLIMRFVDLAYDPKDYSGALPSLGRLKGFRVNERFLRLMDHQGAQPRVTVQPNFDVVIESDFYPANLIHEMAALGELVSSPASGQGAYVGIFQLKKAAVASALVRQPDLDIIARLMKITGRDLPANVQVELEEWEGHAEQFILYEGFALLESANMPAEAEAFVVEKISSTLNLMCSSEKLFATLERQGHVPLRIQHSSTDFVLLPESVSSAFPKEQSWLEAPKQARQVKVNRSVTVSYQFPDEESFAATQKMLAALRCPFQIDAKTRSINIQQKDQPRFDESLIKLAGDFLIEAE